MFHGGTNFGFMNGANCANGYEPDVASYDYDSPVSESGELTKKYFSFRDVIAKYRPGVKIPEPPAPLSVIEIPEFELKESAALWSHLPDPASVDTPRSMEILGQSHGSILYRTTTKDPVAGELVIHELRSYAGVFVDGKHTGTLDRRKKGDRLDIEGGAGSTFDVLVEGTGRINFTAELRSERQGINGAVTLAGQELSGWQVFPLPMDDLTKIRFSKTNGDGTQGPGFCRGQFVLREVRGCEKGPAMSLSLPRTSQRVGAFADCERRCWMR
jgi:beta-galactosidase